MLERKPEVEGRRCDFYTFHTRRSLKRASGTVKGDSKGALRELGGALRGTSSQFLSASEFLVFSLSLKSKVILSFRFGFSMSNLYIETPGEVS